MQKLEAKFMEWFVTKAPFQLPENAKTTLVRALPWLTLIGGILSALAVINLYRLALWAQDLGNYANQLHATYGYAPAAALGPIVWVSLIILAVEAILFFAAFPALRAGKKSGWNLLFYVAAANALYALVYLFANQDVASFIFSVISSVIGLYLLFQIRSYYSDKSITPTPKATSSTSTPKSPNQ